MKYSDELNLQSYCRVFEQKTARIVPPHVVVTQEKIG